MDPSEAITLTDSIVRRIRALQVEHKDHGLMLRVAVNGGGCQGFEYKFGFAHDIAVDDRVFEKDGIRVVVDEASLPLMDGSTIDFIDDLGGASFKVINPHAVSTCGCGTSFSVGTE